jgi:pimeloyl-ACP methyl ester carboxylesterase
MGIIFAANFPELTAGLIIGDSALGNPPSPPPDAPVKPPLVFETVQAAMENFTGNSNPPRISWDEERARAALRETENGFMLKRDPNFANIHANGEENPTLRFKGLDVWAELARVSCPVMILRGTLSDRYPPEKLDRLAKDFGHVKMTEIQSHHDLAGQAPDAVIGAVREFLV